MDTRDISKTLIPQQGCDRKQENGVVSSFVINQVGEVFNKIQNLCLFPPPPPPPQTPSAVLYCSNSLLTFHLFTKSSFILSVIIFSYKSRTQTLEILFTRGIFFPQTSTFRSIFTILLLRPSQLVKKLNTFARLFQYFPHLNAASVKTALRKQSHQTLKTQNRNVKSLLSS